MLAAPELESEEHALSYLHRTIENLCKALAVGSIADTQVLTVSAQDSSGVVIPNAVVQVSSSSTATVDSATVTTGADGTAADIGVNGVAKGDAVITVANLASSATVTAKNADGVLVGDQSYADLFATGGISSSAALAADLTAVTKILTNGVATYTVYMPLAVGPVTVAATLGTGVATAIQATAAAQDAADAVAALSVAVTEMVSALKKQITALTNLVIKIQKKVKA